MIGNNAIYVNGPYQVDEHITTRGSDWLFAVTAIMGATAIGVLVWGYMRPLHDRMFHYISSALLMTAAVAYYTMASNLGYASIQPEFIRSGAKVAGMSRQVFYARYIDWFITTPLLLLDLLLSAGLNWSTILFTIFLDWVMITTGLFGALTASRYKWGYYAVGNAAYIGILYNIIVVGRKNAGILGADISKSYLMSSLFLIVIWFFYPIAWGLAEGGNVISSDGESIFYGVLDVLAKPVFTLALLWSHRNVDYSRFGFNGRQRFNVGNVGGTTPVVASRV